MWLNSRVIIAFNRKLSIPYTIQFSNFVVVLHKKRTPILCPRALMIGCFNIMLILNLCPLPTHPKRGIVCQTAVMASEENSAEYLLAG